MSQSAVVNGQSVWQNFDRYRYHLDYHQQRASVIAGNLANIDTPGYHAKDLVFKEVLTTEQNETDVSVAREISVDTVRDDDEFPDLDGNTVSLERQLSKSSSNFIRYKGISEMLARQLGFLKYSISSGQ